MPRHPQLFSATAMAAMVMVTAFILGVGTHSASAADSESRFCGTKLLVASQGFARCISTAQRAALRKSSRRTSVSPSRMKRCEAKLQKTIHVIDAHADKHGFTCSDRADYESIRRHALSQANSTAAQLGVASRVSVNATPGTDTLVEYFPIWCSGKNGCKVCPSGKHCPPDPLELYPLLEETGKQLTKKYNPELKARGFSEVKGFMIPVMGYKAQAPKHFCPYLDDLAGSGGEYLNQMKTLRKATTTSTLVGTVNVGIGEPWTSKTPSDLVSCLQNFKGIVDGLIIDDEYNVLSDAQTVAIMNWCNTHVPSKQCGFFLGHSTTVVNYKGPMQNICMNYDGGEAHCDNQAPRSRNIYKEEKPPWVPPQATLPFDIYDSSH